MISPEIKEKAFKLLGCIYYGNPFHSAGEWTYENEIGKLWMRFGKLTYKNLRLLSKICKLNVAFELHLEPEEYKKTKFYYVMVGMEASNIEEIPLEMFVKILPYTTYVIFTTTVENKDELGAYMFKEWIPKNGYEQAFPYIIQGYDEARYNPKTGLDDPKNEIDWYIPINKINSI